MRTIKTGHLQSIGPFLEVVYQKYHRRQWLGSDPLEFVLQFQDPWDQEAVALVAAQLAYGNVRQIRRSIQDWLSRIGAQGSPSSWVREGVWRPGASKVLDSFVHRLHRGADLLALSRFQSLSWRKWGSLGSHLEACLRPGDRDFGAALNQVIMDWKKEWQHCGDWTEGPIISRSLQHLISSPQKGSCCKRWCMLLRWMGRRDDLDPGLWTEGSPLVKGEGIKPSQLVIPLDTHVGQICKYMGLTHRKSLNWRAAVEITERLRFFDPSDPVKYDFALARLGILDLCRKKYIPEVCSQCALFGVCQLANPKISIRKGKMREGAKSGTKKKVTL
ncbi:MAG: TIGR02757 family protein [Oligoflexia bacterium]